MALKALLLRKKLDGLQAEKAELASKRADLKKREDDAAQAIEELSTDATDDEKKAVEDEVTDIDDEKKKLDAAEADLNAKLKAIESELAEIEEKGADLGNPDPAEPEERKEIKPMITRVKFFGLDPQERDALFADEKVKDFLGTVRTAIKDKRAVSNVGLTIPQNFLPLIRQIAEQTSKLMPLVRSISLTGTGRQNIMGSIPEAVWTEMCGKLNELSFGFNNVEVDGYKVGGYMALCNAVLEDNDVNLASLIIEVLGKAIGKALDKAIVYGTGTKMPLGIVTRLAQATAPASYPATARTWEDLHTSHVIKQAAATGKTLFKNIIMLMSTIKNDYNEDGLVWIMNSKTKTKLLAESLDAITASAVIAGMGEATMPIVGGKIITLEWMADNDIVFGYMPAYLLVQRAGVQMAVSEHLKFLDDQTVFKGTARYDGVPVIPEAFAIVNINNIAPTTTITFAADTANAS